MSDLRDRIRSIERTSRRPPDLWPDISAREPRDSRRYEAGRLRRFGVAATVLALAVVAVGALVHAFAGTGSGHATVGATPSTAPRAHF